MYLYVLIIFLNIFIPIDMFLTFDYWKDCLSDYFYLENKSCLEYQQNNFSLQFCPSYNLPIWLHAFNFSADMELNWEILSRKKNVD